MERAVMAAVAGGPWAATGGDDDVLPADHWVLFG
jgi:hypothetical protein